MKRSIVRLIGVSAALSASAVMAGDIVWQGVTSGTAQWNETSNWAGGKVPGYDDCAVFGDGIGALTVTLGDSTPFRAVTVLSGSVTLGEANSGALRTGEVTNVFDVAEGAVVTLAGSCYSLVNNTTGVICKKGKGTFNGPSAQFSTFGNTSKEYAGFHLVEGTVVFPGAKVLVKRYVVERGTSLTIGNKAFHGYEVVDVKKGASVSIAGADTNTPGGFLGDGEITIPTWSGVSNYFISLFGGPYRFGGTLNVKGANYTTTLFGRHNASQSIATTEEEKHFVLGSSNALAQVARLRMNVVPEFASGIGEFWMGKLEGVGDNPVVVEDENGEPIRLHATLVGAESAVEGKGDFYVSQTSAITGSQLRVTGRLGVDNGATLTLGDTTDAGSADLATVESVVGPGALNLSLGPSEATLAKPIRVTGNLTVSQPTVLSNYCPKSGNMLIVNAATTLAGKCEAHRSGVNAAAALTIDGMRLYGNYADFSSVQPEIAYKPGGLIFGSSAANPLVVKNGGELWIGGGNKSVMPSSFLLNGGRIVMLRSVAWAVPSYADSHVIASDGGIVSFCGWTSGVGFVDTDTAWTLKVGAAGHRYDYFGLKSGPIWKGFWTGNFPSATTADGVAKDGGILFDIPGELRLSATQAVKGPICLADGRMMVREDAVDATTHSPFGTGDLVMCGGCLGFDDFSKDLGMRLANGAGARVKFVRPSVLDMSVIRSNMWADPAHPQTLTFGADDAAQNSVLSREAGGVLFLVNRQNGVSWDGTRGKVFFKGGLETVADGRLALPFLSDVGYMSGFLSYDATDGVTAFTNYVATFAGSDTTLRVKASAAGLSVPAGEEVSVGAVLCAVDAHAAAPFINVGAGAVLHVGDGVHPGCVFYGGKDGTGGKTYTIFTGDGTVDFGSCEGVIASGARANEYYAPESIVDVALAGTGGLTFAAPVGGQNNHIFLKKASSYTGGTRIGSVCVVIENGGAFGSGLVSVLPGKMTGGAVRFDQTMTMPNAFKIGGYGAVEKKPTAVAMDTYAHGALHFKSPGVHLTGAVELDGIARVSAAECQEADASGVFDGIVSGGSLQVLSAEEAPVVFTRSNTFTGGTEVVRSTVTLRGTAPSLGTGTVYLDQSALRFENTSELVFTNTLRGTEAVIALAGAAPVTFVCNTEELDAKVDLCGTDQTFKALPPFPVIDNSDSHYATLRLAPNLGTVAWGDRQLVNANVCLSVGEGTVLDLGGATLNVRTVLDDSKSRIVNGSVNESKPKTGLVIILR